MKHIVINCEEVAAPFMELHCHSHGAFTAGRAIGLVDFDDEERTATMVAACWYESWNGANINMHVAALPGRRWMTRDFLFAVFDYPFRVCNVKRITGLVPSHNYDARRFDEHIGFKLEATLKDAAPDGDLLVYAMFKQDCKWLNLRRGMPPILGAH